MPPDFLLRAAFLPCKFFNRYTLLNGFIPPDDICVAPVKPLFVPPEGFFGQSFNIYRLLLSPAVKDAFAHTRYRRGDNDRFYITAPLKSLLIDTF